MQKKISNPQKCPSCSNDAFKEILKMETVQSGVHVMPDGKVDYDNAGSIETVDGKEDWDTRELECEKCESTFHLVDGILKPSAKKLILSMSDNSEFFSEAADYAIVELSADLIARIRRLSEAVRSLDVYKISEFNYHCDFMVADYDADPENGKVALKEFVGRMECNTLNVTDTGFYWSGLDRHTDVRWSTDTVLLTTLDETDVFDQREVVSDEQEAI